MPLFLFVILFGVSMDYQVFLVSRIREAVQHGVPTRAAVFEGIISSAGVITSAAVVMVSVFVSFMFLHLIEVKQIGFGLAVAVLVDAFIVRILILPALLSLLADATWWPSQPAPAVNSTPPTFGGDWNVGGVEFTALGGGCGGRGLRLLGWP